MSTQQYLFALEEFAGKDIKIKLDQMHFVMDNLISPTSAMDERIKQAYMLSYSMGLEVIIRTLLSNDPDQTFAKETAKINQIYDSYLSAVNVYNNNGVISIEFGYKRIGGKQTQYKPYEWTSGFTVNPNLLKGDTLINFWTALLLAHSERPYFHEGFIQITKKEIDPDVPRSNQKSVKSSQEELLRYLEKFTEETKTVCSVVFNRRTIYFNKIGENSISFIYKGKT